MPFWMASHLTQRGDIFYFRARVPTRFVPEFGRTIVSISLGARDPALAKARARERRVELEQALQAALPHDALAADAGARAVLHLSDKEISSLCARHRAQVLADNELARLNGHSANDVEIDRMICEGALERACRR